MAHKNDFIGVTLGKFIYVDLGSRAEFDKIERQCEDRGENEEGNHVLVRTVKQEGVWVIFQYWIKLRGKVCDEESLTPA